ncbi:MAG: hypothetical protein E7551_09035 [Ruminococcaceae bacterium]|nr:hypothetical protein [Oscillospiraceae bacterium]
MKKFLAILLTLILTFSCFSLALTGTAIAEEETSSDVIMQSDFGNTTSTNLWQAFAGTIEQGLQDTDGTYYARLTSTTADAPSFYSAPATLTPGYKYELSYYIRVPETSESYKGTLTTDTTSTNYNLTPKLAIYESGISSAGRVNTLYYSVSNEYAYNGIRRSDFEAGLTVGSYETKQISKYSLIESNQLKSVYGSELSFNEVFADWTKITFAFTAIASDTNAGEQVVGLNFSLTNVIPGLMYDIKDVKLVCTDDGTETKTIMQSDFNDADGTNWRYTSNDVTYCDDNGDGVNDYASVKVNANKQNAGLFSTPFNLVPGNEYELTYYIRVPEESRSFLVGEIFYAPTVAFYQPKVNSTGTSIENVPAVSTVEASNNFYAYKYTNTDDPTQNWSRRSGFSATWTIDGYTPKVITHFSDFDYRYYDAVLGATNADLNEAFEDWTKVTVNFTAVANTEDEKSQVTAVGFYYGSYKSSDNVVFDIKDVKLMETAAIEEEKPEEIVLPELPDYPALPDVETPAGNTYTTTVTGENCNAFVSDEVAFEGNKVIVSAVPNAGYKFAGWYENDVLVSPEKQFIFTVSENRTLVAKSIAVTEENTEIAIYPDVSYDGIVDLTDITNIAKKLAGWDVENINTSRIDVDGDGEVNLNDLVLSAQYVAGWDVKNNLASKEAYLLPEEDLDAEGLSDTVKAGESEYFNKSTIINEGNRALLVNLFEKANRGEAITVVSIGGSITQGVKDGDGNDRSYGKLVSEWIAEKFGVEVTNINAGIGSTGSLYGIHRLESDVLSHNPDLVILEYSVNDISSKQGKFPYLETYEAIIRRVLEKDIALLTAVFGGSGTTFYKDYLSLHIHSALHYDLPVIDYYSALFRYLEKGVISWYDENDNEAGITKDKLHPNTTGHIMIASAMCYYLDDVYNKYQAGEVYETAIDIPKKTLFKNADVYETATFLASTNDLGYETITPYFNYENRFTAAKVHGDSSKMGKGWVCENQKGVIVFDLQDVTSISLSMMQKTTVSGTYSITINGKTIVNNQTSSTANNVIWPTYCRVFNEPTDLVVTITCHEGTVGVGPIGVTY